MMRSPLTIIWLPIRFILWVLLTPIVTLGYLLLVLCVGVPSHIVRKLVSVIGQWLDDDLAKLVTAGGTIPGRDFKDWSTNPSQSVSVVIKLKGRVSLGHAHKHILRNLIHKWNSSKEQLENPELQQYITKRLGFLFFKCDRQFNISNHVRLYKSKDVVDDERLVEIWEKVSRRPYAPKRSPWEILIIPHYHPTTLAGIKVWEQIAPEEQRSAVIFRIHHALADGYAIYRLLLELSDDGIDFLEKEMSAYVKPKYFNLLLNLKALILGPMQICKTALQGFDANGPLHYLENNLTGKYHVVQSSLDLNLISNAKRLHDVSFHSVLIAGVTGGMRNYMRKNGIKVPMLPVRIGMPIPKPGHSDKLRNEFLSSLMNLPIGMKSSKHRLILCEQRIKELRTGALVPFLTFSMRMIGGFPVQCARCVTQKSAFSLVYSEMKGPGKCITILDGKMVVEDLMYSVGLGTDDLGMACSVISYNGKIHIILTLDRAIFKSKEKANELLNLIITEIQDFQYGDSSNL